ncbi:unnamed protein product [Schistosoma margrebowiei]|uniref:Peptidase M13 C-terminal domain-containing protein n=1 Tax=Schistosoma margrebowiei TaxID=48269 RepID=A0AA84ZVZ3_9TREM|nr:unnamed protein product [Schistosoma margrebowiei]
MLSGIFHGQHLLRFIMIELLSVLLCVISEFVGTNETTLITETPDTEFVGTNETTLITETPDTATNTLEETIQNNADNSLFSNHCTDFYETACGEWEKQNPLSGDSASSSVMQQMGMNVDYYFWKIIANDSYYKEDWRLQSARAFYKSCVNSRNSNTTRESRHHLIDMYFGGWQLIPSLSTEINNTNGRNQSQMNNNLTDLFLPILTQTGRSPLFSMNIAEDIFAVIISPGQFAFRTDLQKTDMDKSEEDYYKLAFETGVTQSQKPQLTDAFRKMIRLGRKSNAKKQLLKEFVTKNELQSICPQIDWSYILEKVLQETGYVKLHKRSIIIQRRNELRQRCAEYRALLTEKGGGSTLRTIAIMDFLREQQKNTLNVHTFGTNHNFNSSSQTHFDGQCIKRLKDTFPWTLERHYIRSHVNETHKAEVINMFNEIKLTITNSIPKIKSFNEEEKKFMKLKVSKMGIFALYSSHNSSQQKENLSTVFQYPIREDNYYTNEFYIRKAKHIDTLKTQLYNYNPSLSGSLSRLVSAYYAMDENRIYVHPGLLQPPLYYENGSLASKFGALGWIISHEIMHGIGIQGVLYDENWNKRTTFDALLSSGLKHLNALCLSHQYASYNYTGLKAFRTDTQEEMLADNDGLKASYHTYKRLLKTSSNNVSQGNHDSLESDRLFFLSSAQAMCGHHGELILAKNAVVMPQVSEKFRVIGALVNSRRFARAYGCPVGSPMNPVIKCDAW